MLSLLTYPCALIWLGVSFYGIYLALLENLVLGIVTLLLFLVAPVLPLSFAIGASKLLFQMNMSEDIVKYCRSLKT